MRLSLTEAKRLGLSVAPIPTTRGTNGRLRKGQMPEDILWMSVRSSYPEAVREYQGAVPGRRFRIDVALVDDKIAIECDGWQYHGKFKSAHATDRERQNLLAVEGWIVLRFTPGQIFKDLAGVTAIIEAAVKQRRALL
ncbi:endonuclease domain-containing protein [Sulfuricystis multivorans]|uniref:endonuclease domain-containing protein n=1 Tax=Sulfuricystis multivorans TaxID=2211108 RepID=UPI000F83B9EF|nr:DUF559 domain-containing protein [Sulfuricystis multivorans]